MLTAQYILENSPLRDDDIFVVKRRHYKEPWIIACEACSLANTLGGDIVIGIGDDDKIIGIAGLPHAKDCIEYAMERIFPLITAKAYTVSVEGKTLLVAHVPAGEQRPYSVNGTIYVRKAGECVRLWRRCDMSEIFGDSREQYFDSTPIPEADLTADIDRDILHQLRLAVGDGSCGDDIALMRKAGAIDAKGSPTVAGVLMLSRKPEAYLPHAVTRCTVFQGKDKADIMVNATLTGPLPRQLRDAMRWLHTNLGVAAMPETALREAVTNALAHRDYTERGASAAIEIFSDRVVISNPGGAPLPVLRGLGQHSVARNPLLASLLASLGLMERAGTGVSRIRRAMLATKLPEARISPDGMFTVTLLRRAATTPQQEKLLALLLRHPTMTLPDMAESLGIGRSTVAKDIHFLKAAGRLRREGRKSDGRWVAAEHGM